MQALTGLINQWRSGNLTAEKLLFDSVYPFVKEIAARQLKNSSSRTLRPTELVNDVLMQLRQNSSLEISNTAHLYALAARMIRFLIVDHVRQNSAEKRGRGVEFVDLEHARYERDQISGESMDWLSLDKALTKLSEIEPQHADFVELRFFAGMTLEEASVQLGISASTASRMWRFASSFLRAQLEVNAPRAQ